MVFAQIEKKPFISKDTLVDVYGYIENKENKKPNFYLGFGKTIANYLYKNSKNRSNENINTSLGNVFEIGVGDLYTNLGINIGMEFKMIEYNAIGNNQDINFEWNTTFLGLNAIGNKQFKLIGKSEIEFQLGVGVQKILGGNQLLGKEITNLAKNNEFDGVFGNIEVGFGLNIINQNDYSGGIHLSYNKATSLDNNSVEELNFSSFQIKLRLCSKR